MVRKTHSPAPPLPSTHEPSPGTLSIMDPAELLAEYNRLSPTKRRGKFKSREEAIARIQAIVASPPADGQTTPDQEPVPAPAKSKKPAGAKREPKNVRARQAEVVIRIMVEENPHREDTAAYAHFEKMRGGITVREYLSKFSEKDQRTARQWLWNIIQKGHVKTLGA